MTAPEPIAPPAVASLGSVAHRGCCVAAARCAAAAGARVLDHAGQLHRPVHAGRARPGAAHRRRRADLVRPGRVRRPRRVHRRLPDARARRLAVADGLDRPGGHRRGRAGAGLDHAAHVGPLPAAGDHRLGPVACTTCSATSTALGKYDGLLGIPAIELLRHRAQHRPQLLLPAVDHRRAGGDRGHAPARFARRPRAARRQGRRDDGRGDGRRHLPRQGDGLRPRGAAGQRLGLAVRALPAHREPVAVRPEHAASSTCSWRCSAASATSGARSSAPASCRS